MTINTVSMLGPGTLTIGGGGGLVATAQVRACALEPTETVKRTEAKRVLSGEELAASETATYSAVLRVTFLQDDVDGGVVDYTYTNAGLEKAFSFKPATGRDTEIAGTLRVQPIKFGGTVDDPSPESEVAFACVGAFPTFTPNTP